MDEATVSADCIRKVCPALCLDFLSIIPFGPLQDIRELRFKATNIAGNQICEECNLPVLSTSLYVFPCLHAFHSHCLCSYVLSSTLDTAVRRNIERLELLTRVLFVCFACSNILNLELQPCACSLAFNFKRVKLGQASPDGPAAAELDDLLGSDCPLCGECSCCRYGRMRMASAAKTRIFTCHYSAGELMLKSLGRPFLTDADAIEAQVWQL